MQKEVEFTMEDFKQLFISLLHGSAMAHTEIFNCPWPNDVKNTFMEITDEALVRGFVKGWIAYKYNDNKVLAGVAMSDIGMLVDALIKVLKGTFAQTVNTLDPSMDSHAAFNVGIASAFKKNYAHIEDSVTQLNYLIKTLNGKNN